MTREEAIDTLLSSNSCFCKHGAYKDCHSKCDVKDALDMAIKALQTDLARDINVTATDAISRQAAIDELVRWGAIPEYNEAEKNILACCIGMLSTLPSVQPQKVIRCKDCKHRPIRPNECESGFGLDFPDDVCPCQCEDGWYSHYPSDDWFCAYGEAKMEEGE